MVPVTKPNTKEVQCQLAPCDETKPQQEVIVTPKSGRVGIFNAEDFLSRAQINDKINNILRSPTKAPNGVRQRSVYTNNNPSPVSSTTVFSCQCQIKTRHICSLCVSVCVPMCVCVMVIDWEYTSIFIMTIKYRIEIEMKYFSIELAAIVVAFAWNGFVVIANEQHVA